MTNAEKGKLFEKTTSEILENEFGISFQKMKIPVGKPPKKHEFDLVSEDERHVVECKAYKYTINGNIPSAKIATINEAVLYLQHIQNGKSPICCIALPKDSHISKNKSLAKHYFDTYKNLLGHICIIEIDNENKKIHKTYKN